jgi:hypothetical protein
MIYRGPGFLAAVVWLGSLLTLFPTLTSETCLSFSVFLCVTGRAYCRERGGEGMGEELNHTTARKPGPLYIIQYLTELYAETRMDYVENLSR